MGAYFQNRYPHLANDFLLARQSIFQNPDHSMMKLGIIAEKLAKEVVQHYNLPVPEATQLCRLNTLQQYGLLPADIASAFHDIRRLRNQASHEGHVNAQDVAGMYTWMDDLVAWFENMMQVQPRPVYQRRWPRSTYGIFGIPVEFYVFVGLPLIFFGSLIYSYVMKRLRPFILPIFLILAVIAVLLFRVGKGRWPILVERAIAKLKSIIFG